MNPYRVNMFHQSQKILRPQAFIYYRSDVSGVEFFIISGFAVIFMIAVYLIIGESYPSVF